MSQKCRFFFHLILDDIERMLRLASIKTINYPQLHLGQRVKYLFQKIVQREASMLSFFIVLVEVEG